MNVRLLTAAAVIAAGIIGFWVMPGGDPPIVTKPSPTPSPPAVSAPPPSPADPLVSRPPTPTATPTPTPTRALPPPPPVDERSALRGLGTRELTAQDRIELKLPEKLWGGVVVTEVDATSPAAEAMLEPGDVIFRAGGNKILNLDDLARALGDRQQTRIQAYRRGSAFEVVIYKPDPAEKR